MALQGIMVLKIQMERQHPSFGPWCQAFLIKSYRKTSDVKLLRCLWPMAPAEVTLTWFLFCSWGFTPRLPALCPSEARSPVTTPSCMRSLPLWWDDLCPELNSSLHEWGTELIWRRFFPGEPSQFETEVFEVWKERASSNYSSWQFGGLAADSLVSHPQSLPVLMFIFHCSLLRGLELKFRWPVLPFRLQLKFLFWPVTWVLRMPSNTRESRVEARSRNGCTCWWLFCLLNSFRRKFHLRFCVI